MSEAEADRMATGMNMAESDIEASTPAAQGSRHAAGEAELALEGQAEQGATGVAAHQMRQSAKTTAYDMQDEGQARPSEPANVVDDRKAGNDEGASTAVEPSSEIRGTDGSREVKEEERADQASERTEQHEQGPDDGQREIDGQGEETEQRATSEGQEEAVALEAIGSGPPSTMHVAPTESSTAPQTEQPEATSSTQHHAGISSEKDDKGIDSTPLQVGSREERELPAPPTPLKETTALPLTGDKEVGDVARAFGKSVSVDDSPAMSTEADKQELGSTSSPPLAVGSTTATPSAPAGRPGGIRIGKGPPPTTQASEEKPFDFNRFLDQMRHRSAGPVGEYVRSFIKGFTKKPYRVADQTKLILDFLDFISLRMRECDVWANLTDTEFENATEAMEKLIMNRLYNYTFSPAIKREGKWSVQTDDLERDRVLKQRIRLFGWITESHLDVPVGDHSKGFIDFAIQELVKINHYKAPRDKVICILNCCKVIFGLIRHLSTQENADTFVPILIFVVLRANPDNLISNVEYISRFRNPERLSSESGYYLSSLMGAIAFIETMDYTSLSNISQQEFEANVEAAVQSMSAQPDTVEATSPIRLESKEATLSTSGSTGDLSSAQMTPQGSVSSNEDGSRALPISAGAAALAKDTRAFIQRTGEAARAGIGVSFGGSVNALGRLFQDGLDGPRTPSGSSPAPGSGRDTPESPAPAPTASARARMWNLFGVDEDQVHPQHVARPPREAGARNRSGPSLNFGSWGRNMRADVDSEPPTPQSEELRQGRFAPLAGQAQVSAPLSERLAKSFEARTPRTPAPGQIVRRESTDPYLVEGDSGVRTPTDDGSDVEEHDGQRAPSANPPAMPRARRSDLSSFLPSFLTEPSLVRTPQTQSSGLPSGNVDTLQQSPLGTPGPLDDEEAAQAAAQIDRAHIDAGVETLKSIFPDMDTSVCRLVLEGCHGDVQAAIDKLLEMS